jgi:hypothetical protein
MLFSCFTNALLISSITSCEDASTFLRFPLGGGLDMPILPKDSSVRKLFLLLVNSNIPSLQLKHRTKALLLTQDLLVIVKAFFLPHIVSMIEIKTNMFNPRANRIARAVLIGGQ